MRVRATIAALGLVIGAALVPAATAAAQADKPKADDYEREVLRLVNEVRAQHGVAPLSLNAKLGRAADVHSQEMLTRDAFTHDSSQDVSFKRRVRRYLRAEHMGEVLAYVEELRGRAEPPKMIAVWQSSAAHLDILVDPVFSRVGFGCRSGRLDDLSVTLCTADLASDP